VTRRFLKEEIIRIDKSYLVLMQPILDMKDLKVDEDNLLKVLNKLRETIYLKLVINLLEKEEGDNYSFSSSPKKEHEKLPGRKESDFSYGHGRKNSFLSNFGGHG